MNELGGYDIEDLRPGMNATYLKTITEVDIVLFAGVSGDNIYASNAIAVVQSSDKAKVITVRATGFDGASPGGNAPIETIDVVPGTGKSG